MKPTASLSLDLDNKWCYMKTRGDAGWETFPSYLDIAVPRALEFLKKRDLNITFFIVGQDAALDKNLEAIAQIPAAGHEIANHSFRHEPFLHLYSKEELVEEFQKTEEAIEKSTGAIPKGFRGPGFSVSPTVLEVLAERGYEYDCSTFPTYIAPVARAFYFLKSPGMSAEEREKLKKLYGKFSDGFQSLKPYKWQIGEKAIDRNSGDDASNFQNSDPRDIFGISFDIFKICGTNLLENGFANVQDHWCSAFFVASSARFFIRRRRS